MLYRTSPEDATVNMELSKPAQNENLIKAIRFDNLIKAIREADISGFPKLLKGLDPNNRD